jgi:hypothetical protein
VRCFVHGTEEASAICGGCNRALCSPCSRRFTLVLCAPCLVAQNRAVSARHWTRLITTVILAGGGFAFYRSFLPPMVPAQQVLGMSVVFPCIYWGWMSMSEHTPNSLVMLTPGAWLFGLAVKLVFATFLGVVMAPLGIIRSVREVAKIRRTASALRAGEI